MARSTRSKPRKNIEAAYKELVNAQEKLFNEGVHGDLTIKCQDKTWLVHKDILCQRCKWFKNACSRDWKEGQTNIIDLSSDDPVALGCFLRYLYTLRVSDTEFSPDGASNAFVIGDKYGVKAHRDAAYDDLLEMIGIVPLRWSSVDGDIKREMVGFAYRIWQLGDIVGVKEFKKRAIMACSDPLVAKEMTALSEFRELLKQNEEFMLSFVQSVAERG